MTPRFYVELCAIGERNSGKTTILLLCEKALREAGFLVEWTVPVGVREGLVVTNDKEAVHG